MPLKRRKRSPGQSGQSRLTKDPHWEIEIWPPHHILGGQMFSGLIAYNSPQMIRQQYLIGTQEYGRVNLRKRISFGLHKGTFLKAFDAIR
jgi:hypothetical protein